MMNYLGTKESNKLLLMMQKVCNYYETSMNGWGDMKRSERSFCSPRMVEIKELAITI